MPIKCIYLCAVLFSSLVLAGRAQTPVLSSLQLQLGSGETYALSSVEFQTESEVIEDPHNGEILKTPGATHWGNVIVSRAITTDVSWWDWRKMVEDRNFEEAKQPFSIVALAEDNSIIVQWDFQGGWPSALLVEKRGTNSVFYEEMQVAHDIPAANHSPVITMPASFSAPVGSNASFTVSASDPDLDPVTLANTLAPAGAVFQNGVFSWAVPVSAIETTQTVTFSANDQRGETNSMVTSQLSITVPRDYDHDQLDDDWEIVWIGNLSSSATDDTDGDDASNLHEFLSGTNPTNSNSRFDVSHIVLTNQQITLTYTAQPGQQYQLECNTNSLAATDQWLPVGDPWTQENNQKEQSFLMPLPISGNAFYRIQTQHVDE